MAPRASFLLAGSETHRRPPLWRTVCLRRGLRTSLPERNAGEVPFPPGPLLAALPVGVVIQRADGSIAACNASAERILGRSTEEMRRGRTLYLDAIREDGSGFTVDDAPFARVLRTGRGVYDVLIGLPRPRGQRTWITASAEPLRGKPREAPAAVVTTLADVSRRVSADEALRENEERYRMIFVDSGDAIVLADPEGALVEMNPAARRLLGFTGRGATLLSALDFLSPATAELLEKELLGAGRVRDFEVALRRRDGQVLQCLVTAVARRAEDGSLRGFQAIVRDVTERRAAEQALRELSGRILRIQDEERRRIARDLHDSTAQVLTALSLNLALIEGPDSIMSPRARGLLADSNALAAQCAQEIRSASYLLHPPLLEEAGVPAALRWYCEGAAGRTGLQVVMQISPNLGRLPVELETTLFRIAQESLSNIHRHSGSNVARIILSRGHKRVRLTVRDAGRGIPAERLALLNLAPASLGLGIAGMRERVRELGGRFAVLSSPAGTTIRVALPVPLSEGGNP
jgi:PAS domain S-box-containing protein